MISLIHNELIKIYSKKSSWIYKIIIVLGIVLISIFYSNLNNDVNNWLFINNIVVDASVLLILFGVIVSSSTVSTEFTSCTIKQLLIRPHKRWRILLSKYFSTIIYNLILALVYIGTIFLMGLALFGSGDFHEEITGMTGDVIGIHVLLKVLYLLPSVLLIYTISFSLSTLFKSQSIAVGVGIFVLFFSTAIGETIASIVDKYTWTKYLIFPHLDLTVFATQDAILNTISLPQSLSILAIYYVTFMALSLWSFGRKDIFV